MGPVKAFFARGVRSLREAQDRLVHEERDEFLGLGAVGRGAALQDELAAGLLDEPALAELGDDLFTKGEGLGAEMS